jgi:hypothetical protein
MRGRCCERAQFVTGELAEFGKIFRAEVGQLMLLPVRPEKLDGTELGA